jgi:cellulose synthase/poly-beta-1,6-N-acetylglucosamine synthase-like glycosyltransferase
LQVVIASDGSTDDTVAIARQFEPSVRVVACERRRGKAAVLNDVVPLARGDLVVLSDARQIFEPHALRALVAPFADEHIGAVSGELILGPATTLEAADAAGVYWTYEKRIRRWESRVDSTMGVTGAIYAIRRRLFEPIPPDTILDDVLIPARAIRRGYRVLFEPAAIAYDRLVASPHDEFVRKVRTIAGTFQFFTRERWTLSPIRNRIWIQTISHKLLRLALPIAYAALLVSNMVLARTSPLFRWTLGLQLVFYGAAVLATSPNVRSHIRAVAIPHMLVLLSWATIVAFVRFATGRQTVTWQRSPSAPS